MKTFNKALVSLACLLMLAVGSSAHAEDRRVWLINDTSYWIIELYVSNRLGEDRKEYMYGLKELKPWSRVRVDIDDGSGSCYFDLKVTAGRFKSSSTIGVARPRSSGVFIMWQSQVKH